MPKIKCKQKCFNRRNIRSYTPSGDNIDESPRVNKKIRLVKGKNSLRSRESINLQTLPNVRQAVYKTFLDQKDTLVKSIKYRGIELKRNCKNMGYKVNDGEISKFKSFTNGVVSFLCEDCYYSTSYKCMFKTHFIEHANFFYLTEKINKTLKSFNCYICSAICQGDVQLYEHIQEHRKSVKKYRENPAKKEKQIKVEDKGFDDEDICDLGAVDEDSDDQLDKNVADLNMNIEMKDECIDYEYLDPKIESVTDDNSMQSEDDKRSVDNYLYDNELDYIKLLNEVVNNPGYVKLECDVALNMFVLRTETKCYKCDFTCKPGDLVQHICEASYVCEICQKRLSTYNGYKYHFSAHFCHGCDFKSKKISRVIKHVVSNEECWFQCKTCKFTSSKKGLYDQHRKLKTCLAYQLKEDNKVFSCGNCSFEALDDGILTKHLEVHAMGWSDV